MSKDKAEDAAVEKTSGKADNNSTSCLARNNMGLSELDEVSNSDDDTDSFSAAAQVERYKNLKFVSKTDHIDVLEFWNNHRLSFPNCRKWLGPTWA